MGYEVKINFGINHEKQSSSNANQVSQLRRALLMGCAYLPAVPLLTMLGGCNEGGNGTQEAVTTSTTFDIPPPPPSDVPATQGLSIPLPPYKTTDPLPGSTAVPTGSTATPPGENDAALGGIDAAFQQTDFTPGPIGMAPSGLANPGSMEGKTWRPPAPSWPKKVGIYNLEYNSFSQVSARGAKEDMGTYLKRSLDNRFALFYRAMVKAFEKHPPKEFEVSFFTAPEFYWNVPWGDFLTEDELKNSADLFLDTVKANVRTLISKFPASLYGHIVLLPGTVAALKPNPNIKPTGSGASKIKVVYEAFNYLTCTHNLPLDDSDYPRPAYMIWPKRVVSSIDFIDGRNCTYSVAALPKNPVNTHLTDSVEKCLLSDKGDLTIYIKFVTSTVGQSFDAHDQPFPKLPEGNAPAKKFHNDIIDGLPFGIDICLDYAMASVQKDTFRMAQLEDQTFKLDFVIAAGMSLDTATYLKTKHVQYAIHNDGIVSTSESSPLFSTIWKLNHQPTGSPTFTTLVPLDAKKEIDTKNGVVSVFDQKLKLPIASPLAGIPEIKDKMNDVNVRIWSLDIDNSDKPGAALVASNPGVNTTLVETIQFME